MGVGTRDKRQGTWAWGLETGGRTRWTPFFHDYFHPRTCILQQGKHTLARAMFPAYVWDAVLCTQCACVCVCLRVGGGEGGQDRV